MPSYNLDTLLHPLAALYPHRPIVHKHLTSLLKAHPTLRPHSTQFHHQDGTSQTLLACQGTIPIFFRGSQYNIPVDVFLPAGYPSKGPRVYVRPTHGMVLKSNHRHVDRGEFLPTLRGLS